MQRDRNPKLTEPLRRGLAPERKARAKLVVLMVQIWPLRAWYVCIPTCRPKPGPPFGVGTPEDIPGVRNQLSG